MNPTTLDWLSSTVAGYVDPTNPGKDGLDGDHLRGPAEGTSHGHIGIVATLGKEVTDRNPLFPMNVGDQVWRSHSWRNVPVTPNEDVVNLHDENGMSDVGVSLNLLTGRGGLRGTEMGRLSSRWDSLVGNGERERRGGCDGPGKFDGGKTLGSVSVGSGGGRMFRGGAYCGGWESLNFLRATSRSSWTLESSSWTISSVLKGWEVEGGTSGWTFGVGGSGWTGTCGEDACGCGGLIDWCGSSCWRWWMWDMDWLESCWLSSAFCCCKALISPLSLRWSPHRLQHLLRTIRSCAHPGSKIVR